MFKPEHVRKPKHNQSQFIFSQSDLATAVLFAQDKQHGHLLISRAHPLCERLHSVNGPEFSLHLLLLHKNRIVKFVIRVK